MDTASMTVSGVPLGEGVAGDIGDRHVAVYNEGGELVVLENVCTHMGCQTEWNSAEKTWDCPCHGSRYDARGKVIRGPAPESLTRLQHSIRNGDIVID